MQRLTDYTASMRCRHAHRGSLCSESGTALAAVSTMHISTQSPAAVGQGGALDHRQHVNLDDGVGGHADARGLEGRHDAPPQRHHELQVAQPMSDVICSGMPGWKLTKGSKQQSCCCTVARQMVSIPRRRCVPGTRRSARCAACRVDARRRSSTTGAPRRTAAGETPHSLPPAHRCGSMVSPVS